MKHYITNEAQLAQSISHLAGDISIMCDKASPLQNHKTIKELCQAVALEPKLLKQIKEIADYIRNGHYE